MNRKVLFVDDEELMLVSYKRKFRNNFELETANRGKHGLEILKRKGPFAVIISDFRMPEMDGVEFLTEAEKLSPDTVRIMLTGQAGFQDAINAVNKGRIFRFLTKPCPPEMVEDIIEAGIEQYRLVHAEKELLEKTLMGSIKTLTDILSLSHPDAFSKSNRIKYYVDNIAKRLNRENVWQYRLSALLSQIGCVVLAPDLLAKVHSRQELSAEEGKIVKSIPEVGFTLLKNIPRLEQVAQIIRMQNMDYDESKLYYKQNDGRFVGHGAQILRIAIDYDDLIMRGENSEVVREKMKGLDSVYNVRFIDALESVSVKATNLIVKTITHTELKNEMIVLDDIRATNGHILIPAGQVVTDAVIQRLQNFAVGVGIREPFRVKQRVAPN